MKLFLFLGVFIVGLVQPAFAEIILCPPNIPLKWKSGLLGGKAQIKTSGEWVDFCTGGEFRELKTVEDDALFVQSCVYGDQSVESQTDLIAHNDPQSLYFSRQYQLIDFELATRTHGICVVTNKKATSCNPRYTTDECKRLD